MSSRRNVPTLVLGLGNLLRRDDGLGVHAIEMLAERELPPIVTLQDGGTPGWGLVDCLQGWPRAILVDAAQMGRAPGSWQRLSLDDLSSEAGQPFLSLHEPGVVEGLNLARALKTLPEEVILYCVEPECIDNGTGLSPVVEAALPELVEDIYQELWKKQE